MKRSKDNHPPDETIASRNKATTDAECCCSSADSGGRIEGETDKGIIARHANRIRRHSSTAHGHPTVRKDSAHHGSRKARRLRYRTHTARCRCEHRAPLPKLGG